jgi:hypothetical protein
MQVSIFVNYARVILVILCCLNPAFADEFEPKTMRFNVAPIASIAIESQGSSEADAADPQLQCSKFRLAQSDVRSYLRSTREISRANYLHTINYSSCASQGTLKLKDGRTGTWLIQKLRGGTLTLSDGKEYYLYCPKCTSKKFAPP